LRCLAAIGTRRPPPPQRRAHKSRLRQWNLRQRRRSLRPRSSPRNRVIKHALRYDRLNVSKRMLIYERIEIRLAGNSVMKVARASVAGVFVLALAVAGCNQNTAETKAPDEQPPAPVATAEPPAAPPPAAPAPIPPSTETQVNTIDSVMLSRPADAPNAMIIRVRPSGSTTAPPWMRADRKPKASRSEPVDAIANGAGGNGSAP